MTNQTQVQQWSAYEDYDGRYTVQDSHGCPVTGAEAIIASAPGLLAALEAARDDLAALLEEQTYTWTRIEGILTHIEVAAKRARGED